MQLILYDKVVVTLRGKSFMLILNFDTEKGGGGISNIWNISSYSFEDGVHGRQFVETLPLFPFGSLTFISTRLNPVFESSNHW